MNCIVSAYAYEIRLPPEPKLQIVAQALFYLPQTWKNFIEKIMVAEKVLVSSYYFNPIT